MSSKNVYFISKFPLIVTTTTSLALALYTMNVSKVKQWKLWWTLRKTTPTTAVDVALASESGPRDLAELLDPTSTAPIYIAQLVNHVRDPAAGAIANFEGTTRDTFSGCQVVELRYEAYEPMAIKRLAAMCAAAWEKWQLIRLAVLHRLGVIPIDEAGQCICGRIGCVREILDWEHFWYLLNYYIVVKLKANWV
jgi:MoaE protein